MATTHDNTVVNENNDDDNNNDGININGSNDEDDGNRGVQRGFMARVGRNAWESNIICRSIVNSSRSAFLGIRGTVEFGHQTNVTNLPGFAEKIQGFKTYWTREKKRNNKLKARGSSSGHRPKRQKMTPSSHPLEASQSSSDSGERINNSSSSSSSGLDDNQDTLEVETTETADEEEAAPNVLSNQHLCTSSSRLSVNAASTGPDPSSASFLSSESIEKHDNKESSPITKSSSSTSSTSSSSPSSLFASAESIGTREVEKQSQPEDKTSPTTLPTVPSSENDAEFPLLDSDFSDNGGEGRGFSGFEDTDEDYDHGGYDKKRNDDHNNDDENEDAISESNTTAPKGSEDEDETKQFDLESSNNEDSSSNSSKIQPCSQRRGPQLSQQEPLNQNSTKGQRRIQLLSEQEDANQQEMEETKTGFILYGVQEMKDEYGIKKAVSNGKIRDCLHCCVMIVASAVKSIHKGAASFSELSKEEVNEKLHGRNWKKTMKDPEQDTSIRSVNELLKSYSLTLLPCWKRMSDDPSRLFRLDRGQFILSLNWTGRKRGHPKIKDKHAIAFVVVKDEASDRPVRLLIDSVSGKKPAKLEYSDFNPTDSPKSSARDNAIKCIQNYIRCNDRGYKVTVSVEQVYMLHDLDWKLPDYSDWKMHGLDRMASEWQDKKRKNL